MADTTTGRNSISKFLIANQESLKPNEFANRKGINVMNKIPKIRDTMATVFETTWVLNPDSPKLLAYHPVAEINKHSNGVRSMDTLNFCVNIITIPPIEVSAKTINVTHAHALTNVPFIDIH